MRGLVRGLVQGLGLYEDLSGKRGFSESFGERRGSGFRLVQGLALAKEGLVKGLVRGVVQGLGLYKDLNFFS